MKIIDLFPNCTMENCSRKGEHKHILPHQQAFLDSPARYVAQIGGYGSAKTTPACVLGHLLSTMIPGNIGIVLRRSMPKLHDSTERIYLEVLERSGVPFATHENRDGWPHRIIYGNGSEVLFRYEPHLGPQYGWFFIDEAQEEPEKTFRDLMGRLRLPHASGFLKGMIATNPPSDQHWIAKTFPKPGMWEKGVKVKGKEVKTTWAMIRSSTYENPFLDSSYIAAILETHSPAEARRIVEGFYGFQQEGKPVFPTFSHSRHVGDFSVRLMPLYRVWDFGFNCPACTWNQIFKCNKGTLHWLVLHELIGETLESEAFACNNEKKTGVLWETKHIFGSLPPQLIVDGADAAGADVNERGPGPIIRLSRPKAQGGQDLRFKYRKFSNIDPGLDLIRKLLNQHCSCGFPSFMVNRSCRVLIGALSGGYHMNKTDTKPVKDGYFDNVVDTVRYCGLLFYNQLLQSLTDKGFDSMLLEQGSLVEETPWGWMERATN